MQKLTVFLNGVGGAKKLNFAPGAVKPLAATASALPMVDFIVTPEIMFLAPPLPGALL